MSTRFGRAHAEKTLAHYGIKPADEAYEWFARLLTRVYTSRNEAERALAATRLAGAAMKSLRLWGERERRSNAQRKVSYEKIIAALKAESSQAAAAAALGIDERQIRNRVPAQIRKAIRDKKRNR